jgi:single-stranded-DNA-specific exonuclease
VSLRWVAAGPAPAARALREAGHPRRLAELLALRGIASDAEASAFLTPARDQLHPGRELLGIDRAVERLADLCTRNRGVAILGDYDVDGISGTALLAAVLRATGARVETLIGRRHEEGYGFHPVHARRAAERGVDLLVTVDCGTNSRAAAEEAARLGLALVIVDHHLPDGAPPPGAVLINPRQAGCRYPFRELTGAGLAFKLAVALLERMGREVPWQALLRIACLGTIADVAPLVGENRVIAALGLEALGSTRSAGLAALFEEAGVRPPLRAEDVGFRLGPRLNAAGRLGSAEPALELLLERDPARARELARRLGRANRERQELEARLLDEARAAIGARGRPPLAVAWSGSWHRGVVGIVAAKLARELRRPVLLLAVEGELATGSGRSVASVHLHDFLAPWAGRLERFGGHAQAVGLTARTATLEALAAEWEEAAATWPAATLQPSLRYDLELELAEVGPGLLDELARLEPFGAGNEEPLFRLGPLTAAGPARRFGNGHASLPLAAGAGAAAPVEAVGWGWADRLGALPESFEVLARVERDRWRGGARLRLEDLRPLDASAH